MQSKAIQRPLKSSKLQMTWNFCSQFTFKCPKIILWGLSPLSFFLGRGRGGGIKYFGGKYFDRLFFIFSLLLPFLFFILYLIFYLHFFFIPFLTIFSFYFLIYFFTSVFFSVFFIPLFLSLFCFCVFYIFCFLYLFFILFLSGHHITFKKIFLQIKNSLRIK